MPMLTAGWACHCFDRALGCEIVHIGHGIMFLGKQEEERRENTICSHNRWNRLSCRRMRDDLQEQFFRNRDAGAGNDG